MGYPKNIKASFDLDPVYGVKRSEDVNQETVAPDFLKEAFLQGGPITQFPFQFSVNTDDSRLLSLELVFTEGLTVPDGATTEFVKTLPLGIDTSEIRALFTPIGYGGPTTTNNAVREAFMSSTGSAFSGSILIFEDYKKTRVNTTVRPGLGMPALNLEYADKIATTPGAYLLGAYSDRVGIFFDGVTNAIKSALVSAYLDKENDAIVFKFKKIGATTSLSFNSGVWVAFAVIK